MLYNKRVIRTTAKTLLVVLIYQLVYPVRALALTTGPTQPEVTAFEPVGTTDMVDMFTGDFVYNIPLLDVEGYPINISYHAGVDMEQEASWVGLGWNINPGAINRAVRGVPDDFKGEELTKELNLKDEKSVRIGTGGGLEAIGLGDPSPLKLNLSLGATLNISNYRGLSADLNTGVGVSIAGVVSAGVNFGVGSQTGADVDYYAGINVASSRELGNDAVGFSASGSHGYNSRSGLKDISVSAGISHIRRGETVTNKKGKSDAPVASSGITSYGTIPIGLRNYVPVITNSATMKSIYGRLKLGGEFAWCNAWWAVKGSVTTVKYQNNGSRKAFGYLYADRASIDDIHDFSRDKDGTYNRSMKYLPIATSTYDVYGISGQGTGGSFRPFRNDYGSVFDPVVKSPTSVAASGQLEGSIGWLWGFGADGTVSTTDVSSGPWRDYFRQYAEGETGSLYENTYLKQAGDISAIDPNYWNSVKGTSILEPDDVMGLPYKKKGFEEARVPRSNMIYYFTADEINSFNGIASEQYINSYDDTFGIGAPTVAQQITRNSGVRKGHQLSEIVQVQGDGRRYIYGLPAMNNIQREATFNVGGTNTKDLARGLVEFSDQDNSTSNDNGIDHFYSSTITPGYAHSYLLTSVLSADYVDLTNNGPTDDDLGSYSKFNYRRTSEDYRWRAPYRSGWAQYAMGFQSDPWDDKGNYLIGSREQWMLHSVESKNFIAEFYTSERYDGLGVTDKIPGGGTYNTTASDNDQKTYKLDSIKLYNKHDRFINKDKAVPIKTVFFEYDYSLCKGIPNTSEADSGKLTLKKIATRYGNSNKSMASPYQFEYSDFNPDYNELQKDRWGSYKPNNETGMSNGEYPFVNQSDPDNDEYASAWNLKKVYLPSGGVIEVEYESDDYAYVQNKRAMEMFQIEGFGNSQNFSRNGQLYYNKDNPLQYIYFKRRPSAEVATLSAKENYLSRGQDIIYFNCNVKLVGNKYEQIKGYAKVSSVGYCNDDHGYVQLDGINIVRSKSKINAITYTALNVGRYNLPHIIYDGFDPNLDPSKLKTILAGLKQGFTEMMGLFKNPIDRMVKKNMAKSVDLTKSYIRLNSPGLKKKGGGHRVKRMVFYDSWSDMAGGDAQNATYGKDYDYTTESSSGIISSGVASYEPLIGGDENPFRKPIPYIAQSGSKFPPHEPVSLFQEEPLAESLYPPGIVGYSKVTVSSIHKDVGRSSQAVDVHQFFTAKEYPVRVNAGPLKTSGSNKPKFSLFVQQNKVKVKQGYTIILNDMHGKPKSVETYERKVSSSDTKLKQRSYKLYKYDIDNQVDVLEQKSGSSYTLGPATATMGYDIDVTLDSRQKIEHTNTVNINANINVSNIAFVVLPIPLGYPWYSRQENEFRSAVSTKVIQRYGMLEEVETKVEDAQTILKNEVYDPTTGQPVITSSNNEYNDKEYSVNYPAYWGYRNMGPAYVNTGYVDSYPKAVVNSSYNSGQGAIIYAGAKKENYNSGDEVLMTYTYDNGGNPTSKTIIGYVYFDDNVQPEGSDCCRLIIKPKFTYNSYTPGWHSPAPLDDTIRNISLKVLRSGRKNRLTESIQSYTSIYSPIGVPFGYISGGGGTPPLVLRDSLSGVIDIVAREFSESNLETEAAGNDELDDHSNGKRGIFRVSKEYTYQVPRLYVNDRARIAGIFYAMSPWKVIGSYLPYCGTPGSITCSGSTARLTASLLYPDFSSINWKLSREVTKWSPFGAEIENKDAVENYSTAVYGYNEELPIAVAYNANQAQVLFDGFEDYRLLQPVNDLMRVLYSPFKSFFSNSTLSANYELFNISSGVDGTSLERNVAHTGHYSLKTTSTQPKLYLNKAASVVDKYASFKVSTTEQRYIFSYWARPITVSGMEDDYSNDLSTVPNTGTPTRKSPIIDKWQQVEYEFVTNSGSIPDTIHLPANCYIDDVRIYPIDANMRSFVYNPINERLMATLDENNYATYYEYDQEGNLVRTKKETERGIITISESRSANTKN